MFLLLSTGEQAIIDEKRRYPNTKSQGFVKN